MGQQESSYLKSSGRRLTASCRSPISMYPINGIRIRYDKISPETNQAALTITDGPAFRETHTAVTSFGINIAKPAIKITSVGCSCSCMAGPLKYSKPGPRLK